MCTRIGRDCKPPTTMEERNEALDLAWHLVEETAANVFITGKAGTGKTTFLRRLKKESTKTIAVLAPTGIAALNAGGTTIHSFFQLSFSPFIPGVGQSQASGARRFDRYSKEKLKVIRSVDTIVIDEISMVRADLLDAIDRKLRQYRNPSLPMGGVQLVMIGDLQQLPPVVKEDEWSLLSEHYRSPFFFDSYLLRTAPYETIELTKVYRQKDAEFLSLLNAIRENRADMRVLDRLNSRYIPNFNPDEKERYIRLMTHNWQQQQFNDAKMTELKGKKRVFKAKVTGDFPESMYPVDAELTLKVGAQVMFVKNDSGSARRYYNGLIGIVKSISDSGTITVTSADTGADIEVDTEVWENISYAVDKADNKMKEKIVGAFTQVPLRAAWAITIHKSQGLTFDKAIINASAAFAHGQTYVALSRCRTLAGLVLERPLSISSIISDRTVTDFIGDCASRQADAGKVERLRTDYRLRLQLELADLMPLHEAMKTLLRAVEIAHSASFPKMVGEFSDIVNNRMRTYLDVSLKFQNQLRVMAAAGASDAELAKRLAAAGGYFLRELEPTFKYMEEMPQNIDNKESKKKFDEALEKTEYEARLKRELYAAAVEGKLTPTAFMKIKRDAAAAPSAWLRAGETSGGKGKNKSTASADIQNPDVYDLLIRWRNLKAAEMKVPAYVVFGNKTLLAISNELPRDFDDLLMIPGIGAKKRAEYGREILEIISDYFSD